MSDNQMLIECMNNFRFAGLFAIVIGIALVTFVIKSFRSAIKDNYKDKVTSK